MGQGYILPPPSPGEIWGTAREREQETYSSLILIFENEFKWNFDCGANLSVLMRLLYNNLTVFPSQSQPCQGYDIQMTTIP